MNTAVLAQPKTAKCGLLKERLDIEGMYPMAECVADAFDQARVRVQQQWDLKNGVVPVSRSDKEEADEKREFDDDGDSDFDPNPPPAKKAKVVE